MRSTYLTYLSAISSDQFVRNMEYPCWRLGLEMQHQERSFGFESAPFFLKKGIFQFGFHKYPLKAKPEDFYLFVKDALSSGYYILGWKQESEKGNQSEDAYIIYGCDSHDGRIQMIFVLQGEIQKAEVSVTDFMLLFMNKKHHRQDGFARFYLLKENPIWDQRQSEQRVASMVERYLNSYSIWEYDQPGYSYGILAKQLAWQNNLLQTTFIAQTQSIYQMLLYAEETEFANEYKEIHWQRYDAIDIERQILTNFCEYLQ